MSCPPRPKVFIDCDPGIDDSVALVDLCARITAGEVEILGICATAGNVSVEDSVSAAISWIDLSVATIKNNNAEHSAIDTLESCPVAAGAAQARKHLHPFTPETHGERGVGYAHLPAPSRPVDVRSGAQLWVDIARAHPQEVTAVITGPCTSFAQALDIEPQLPELLRSVTIMGGSFRGFPGNTSSVAEWNAHVDPEAADYVCTQYALASQRGVLAASQLPRWCGLNFTHPAVVWPADVQRLVSGSGSSAVATALADALRFYFEFHESMNEGYLAIVHDPVAMDAALSPQDLQWIPTYVRCETNDPDRRGFTSSVQHSSGSKDHVNALLPVDNVQWVQQSISNSLLRITRWAGPPRV